MSAWTSDELQRIGAAEELELRTLRSDGTQRKPVTISAVRNGDDLFIRSWLGEGAAHRAKYTRVAPSYVEPMLSPQARATTLEVQPR